MVKKRIIASEILSHIHGGCSDEELMSIYKLTPHGLESVYCKLLEAGLVERSRVFPRLRIRARPDTQHIRKLDRKEIFVPLPIVDADDAAQQGTVVNMTIQGVGVSGLDGPVNERKTLRVIAKDLFHLENVVFDARRRWTTKTAASPEPLSGFEIISISKTDAENLQTLLDTLEYMYK